MSVDSALVRLRESNPVPSAAVLHDESRDYGALLRASMQRTAAVQAVGPSHRSSESPNGRVE